MTTIINGDSNINLDFTTGGRITGDFSNATVANRVAFQNSVTNGATSVGAMPNGTGSNCAYNIFAGSDPANTSFGQFRVGTDTSDVRISSGIAGTGTYLPMTFYAGGSERVRIDTSGNVGIGTSSPSNLLHVSQASSDFQIRATGTSAANAGAIRAYNAGGEASVFGTTGASNTGYGANLGVLGTVTNIPQVFVTNNTERARIDPSGNLLVGTTSIAGPGLTTIVAGLYRTLSGNGTANNATSTTLFSISTNTAYFVTVQTGNASGLSSTALVHYVSGGNPVVKTNIAQDNANFTITISGTNVQVTNNLGGVINYSFSALRVG